MKFTSQQNEKFTRLYEDYSCIESKKDLSERGISLSDYYAIPEVFKEIRECGRATTFISSVSAYFKRYGFKVEEVNVNFRISI